jgi:hypothetical protein
MAFNRNVLRTNVLNKEVSWRGRIPGVFTGVHTFILEQNGSKTVFRQGSTFSGLATTFIGNDFVEGGKKGFEEMEKALKQRVENASIEQC